MILSHRASALAVGFSVASMKIMMILELAVAFISTVVALLMLGMVRWMVHWIQVIVTAISVAITFKEITKITEKGITLRSKSSKEKETLNTSDVWNRIVVK